jgi:anti-sigma factor RsiW
MSRIEEARKLANSLRLATRPGMNADHAAWEAEQAAKFLEEMADEANAPSLQGHALAEAAMALNKASAFMTFLHRISDESEMTPLLNSIINECDATLRTIREL